MNHATSRRFMPSPKRHRRYYLLLKVEMIIEVTFTHIIASRTIPSTFQYCHWIGKFLIVSLIRHISVTLICCIIHINVDVPRMSKTCIIYSLLTQRNAWSQIFRSGIILFIFRYNTFRLLFGFDRLVIRRSGYQRYSCKTYCCNYCNHH